MNYGLVIASPNDPIFGGLSKPLFYINDGMTIDYCLYGSLKLEYPGGNDQLREMLRRNNHTSTYQYQELDASKFRIGANLICIIGQKTLFIETMHQHIKVGLHYYTLKSLPNRSVSGLEDAVITINDFTISHRGTHITFNCKI